MSQEIRNIAKQIGLQCYLTIPRCVTILCDNQIDYNENKNVLKYLNKVPTSNDCFPYEYIDADVNKKLEKNKGRLAGNEMEKETKHYVESFNHTPNWLKTIIIEINKFLINR